MLVFLILGFSPLLLLLALVIAMYLTVIELRELQPHWAWWIWWLLVVFMTHFVGYIALRVYAAVQRHNARA